MFCTEPADSSDEQRRPRRASPSTVALKGDVCIRCCVFSVSPMYCVGGFMCVCVCALMFVKLMCV